MLILRVPLTLVFGTRVFRLNRSPLATVLTISHRAHRTDDYFSHLSAQKTSYPHLRRRDSNFLHLSVESYYNHPSYPHLRRRDT
jgi:hypothetical protein